MQSLPPICYKLLLLFVASYVKIKSQSILHFGKDESYAEERVQIQKQDHKEQSSLSTNGGL